MDMFWPKIMTGERRNPFSVFCSCVGSKTGLGFFRILRVDSKKKLLFSVPGFMCEFCFDIGVGVLWEVVQDICE